jgi:hypothetical protein
MHASHGMASLAWERVKGRVVCRDGSLLARQLQRQNMILIGLLERAVGIGTEPSVIWFGPTIM